MPKLDLKTQFLKDSLFEDLLKFQTITAKPNLIGLIESENCMDSTALESLKEGSVYGNYLSGIEAFYQYKRLFFEYQKLLKENGDLPIYPNKETFLKHLTLDPSGYNFLNFSSVYEVKYCSDGETEITAINIPDRRQSRYCYKITKGLVSRYFSTKVNTSKDFEAKNAGHCLTLSMENITDEEFNKIFKASNFDFFTMGDIYPAHEINKLIKRMIEDGKKYDKDHPLNRIKSFKHFDADSGYSSIKFQLDNEYYDNFDAEDELPSFFPDTLEIGKSFHYPEIDGTVIIKEIDLLNYYTVVITLERV